jgi:hypothetical protein
VRPRKFLPAGINAVLTVWLNRQGMRDAEHVSLFFNQSCINHSIYVARNKKSETRPLTYSTVLR